MDLDWFYAGSWLAQCLTVRVRDSNSCLTVVMTVAMTSVRENVLCLGFWKELCITVLKCCITVQLRVYNSCLTLVMTKCHKKILILYMMFEFLCFSLQKHNSNHHATSSNLCSNLISSNCCSWELLVCKQEVWNLNKEGVSHAPLCILFVYDW